jgi:nucleotidyltransferase substrate binding protein (TIGR01987 family)
MTTAKPRWEQRYENFQQALQSLDEALQQETFSDLEKSGVIQRFEYTYELAWQTLQDFLAHQGYQVKGPKPVIQQALRDAVIQDWRGWHDMHEDRQATVHTYNQNQSETIFEAIRQTYHPLFQALNQTLKQAQENDH